MSSAEAGRCLLAGAGVGQSTRWTEYTAARLAEMTDLLVRHHSMRTV
jgi:hypothetical protein